MLQTKKIPCEVWSRVVGYLRPTQSWAAHKKLEFKQRKTYVIKGERITND